MSCSKYSTRFDFDLFQTESAHIYSLDNLFKLSACDLMRPRSSTILFWVLRPLYLWTVHSSQRKDIAAESSNSNSLSSNWRIHGIRDLDWDSIGMATNVGWDLDFLQSEGQPSERAKRDSVKEKNSIENENQILGTSKYGRLHYKVPSVQFVWSCSSRCNNYKNIHRSPLKKPQTACRSQWWVARWGVELIFLHVLCPPPPPCRGRSWWTMSSSSSSALPASSSL